LLHRLLRDLLHLLRVEVHVVVHVLHFLIAFLFKLNFIFIGYLYYLFNYLKKHISTNGQNPQGLASTGTLPTGGPRPRSRRLRQVRSVCIDC
jgi:hypothetical protein